MADHLIQQRTPIDIHQRLDEVVAEIKALQQSVAALHGLQQTLLQEVLALKQAQNGQADKLEQVKKEIYRGRWWRQLTRVFWLLVMITVVGAALFFLADWQALFQFFV